MVPCPTLQLDLEVKFEVIFCVRGVSTLFLGILKRENIASLVGTTLRRLAIETLMLFKLRSNPGRTSVLVRVTASALAFGPRSPALLVPARSTSLGICRCVPRVPKIRVTDLNPWSPISVPEGYACCV